MPPPDDVLVALNSVTIQRNGYLLLNAVSFQLRMGEYQAVVGPTGSGKTTLLRTIAGQLPASTGSVTRRHSAVFVSFREESDQFSYSRYFYQQRYQATMSDSRDSEPITTVRNFLNCSDAPGDLASVKRLGLELLLNEPLLKLSNGQTRKARIGKALLQRPAILLLDNPFVGLDTVFRAELSNWLGHLVRDGLTLMLVTEPDEIPPFVTHVVDLKQGQIRWQGATADYRTATVGPTIPMVPWLQTRAKPVDFTEAFRLNDVTVRYGETLILNAVNWTVRAAERWALLGPNGAGKSVLLSLLYGDHPQAYANDVRVFGHRRGKAGESIWDVKRRIGFVSPELHLYFPQQLSVRQVALTGLTDTLIVPPQVTAETEADLQALLTYFGLANLINRSFGTLSAGEQRIVLLIRAVLKNPPVLLLDEPFQVLDAHAVGLARRLLDSLPNKTILFVSHNRNELPETIGHVFELTSVIR